MRPYEPTPPETGRNLSPKRYDELLDASRRLRRARRELSDLEFTVREQADTTRDQFLADIADDLKRILAITREGADAG